MANRADKEVSKLKIKDEIGQNIQGRFKEQLITEIKLHSDNLEAKQKGIDRFRKQIERDTRIWEIMMTGDNHKRIEPVFKYELNEEYWTLAKSQIQDKIDMERMQSEGRLKGMEIEYNAIKEQLEDCKSKLDDLNKGE